MSIALPTVWLVLLVAIGALVVLAIVQLLLPRRREPRGFDVLPPQRKDDGGQP
jgi:hypothetical protein